MERKKVKDIFRVTNPIKWSKNTIILILGLFYIFGQVYELEYRTKEIKINLSKHRLDNSPFYKYIPLEERNKANNYLIEKEDKILQISIDTYQKRVALQALFFLLLLVVTNLDFRKRELKIKLKRYKRELAHNR